MKENNTIFKCLTFLKISYIYFKLVLTKMNLISVDEADGGPACSDRPDRKV